MDAYQLSDQHNAQITFSLTLLHHSSANGIVSLPWYLIKTQNTALP
jgi:hypothetical protein